MRHIMNDIMEQRDFKIAEYNFLFYFIRTNQQR